MSHFLTWETSDLLLGDGVIDLLLPLYNALTLDSKSWMCLFAYLKRHSQCFSSRFSNISWVGYINGFLLNILTVGVPESLSNDLSLSKLACCTFRMCDLACTNNTFWLYMELLTYYSAWSILDGFSSIAANPAFCHCNLSRKHQQPSIQQYLQWLRCTHW